MKLVREDEYRAYLGDNAEFVPEENNPNFWDTWGK